jgi:hypothetical protein
MEKLPSVVSNTELWKRTLGTRDKDQYYTERERLRNAFLTFREKSAILAAEIQKDIPELTVHDITHIDALWEIGDIIIGNEFTVTPTEAFALGGAFLLHDLALSVASLQGGVDELRNSDLWRDAVTQEYRTMQEIRSLKYMGTL